MTDPNAQKRKQQLDYLVLKHKGQPVGDGYIDIIVSRDNYAAFVEDLTTNKFAIVAVSWWCHCTPENKTRFGCPHGYGGPKSIYFDGWFSERSHDFDEVVKDRQKDEDEAEFVKRVNDTAMDIIENKRTVPYADGTIH